ncbi:MAG: putative DNA modification/repair radical SAM protein [Acidobacteria bacterium]|nr:putative DNA modification/repair radical SAM protein [Acidobacteriota bacterium]
MVRELAKKLGILADSAKYDASCASTRTSRDPAAAPGICHSYTPDGRCVSLLKVLLTNYCIYDCAYCVNRASNDLPRARFAVDEIVQLTIDFHQRNYIDGLFLSSGVIQSPDYTMEQIVAVARSLLVEHGFAGYIHLKAMPGVSQELLRDAGLWADRLSVNIELPTTDDIRRLAPDKSHESIETVMAGVKSEIDASAAGAGDGSSPPPYAAAGQTTQMIVGATGTSDATILTMADRLYARHNLRRVYYTAYSPIPGQEGLFADAPIVGDARVSSVGGGRARIDLPTGDRVPRRHGDANAPRSAGARERLAWTRHHRAGLGALAPGHAAPGRRAARRQPGSATRGLRLTGRRSEARTRNR